MKARMERLSNFFFVICMFSCECFMCCQYHFVPVFAKDKHLNGKTGTNHQKYLSRCQNYPL